MKNNTTDDAKAEMDAMIADLERDDAAEAREALEYMRETRVGVDDLDAIGKWGDDRQREWAARLSEQMTRFSAIAAAHERLPREGETASDLDREADRLAKGKLRPELTAAEREEAVRQVQAAGQLVRDRAALLDEIDGARTEFAQQMAARTEQAHRRAAALRRMARNAGTGTTVWRLNQERRREKGRGREK